MSNTNNSSEFRNSLDGDAFRMAVTSEIDRVAKVAVTSIETSFQRAEKSIDEKFNLLRDEFEKASRKLRALKK